MSVPLLSDGGDYDDVLEIDAAQSALRTESPMKVSPAAAQTSPDETAGGH